MAERTSIVNISGDYEETLLQLAKHLGRSKLRREVFNVIYGRGTKPLSKKQIMKAAGISNKGTNAQKVQNELNHLASHHLIISRKNEGQVGDGSLILYEKDKSVRASKKDIVRFADNKAAAEKVPTKRRSIVRGLAAIRGIERRNLRKKRLTVLYLLANPDRESMLRLDVEVRRVQEQIRGSRYRDHVVIEYRPAADLNSLLNGLNDCRPNIVHFSGHGSLTGIVTDKAKIGKASESFLRYGLLAKALSATDFKPKLVVLNSCHSAEARKNLLPVVDIVVGMKRSISDVSASVFAPIFYAALASGQSVQSAFAQAQLAVEQSSISELDIPVLFHGLKVLPAKVTLV